MKYYIYSLYICFIITFLNILLLSQICLLHNTIFAKIELIMIARLFSTTITHDAFHHCIYIIYTKESMKLRSKSVN